MTPGSPFETKRFAEGTPQYHYFLPTAADQRAAQAALGAFGQFFEEFGNRMSGVVDPVELLMRLTRIAGQYNNERLFRARLSTKELQRERKKVRNAARRLEMALDELSAPSLIDLNPLLQRRFPMEGKVHAQPVLRQLLTSLKDFQPPPQTNAQRGPRSSEDVRLLFRELTALWRDLTGADVNRNTRSAKGKDGRVEFVSIDMLFIQRISRSIDENVGVAKLKAAAKFRPQESELSTPNKVSS